MLKKQENGRSMIEMLGVLAVIGVLSVGGIAGYTSAMNKHRANELLNEASKRAVVIVPQIAAGNTPSLGEFTNNDLGYGTFVSTVYGENGTAEWTSTDKKFTLSITGVSEAVCNQMKNIAGGVIKDFNPKTCVSGNGNNVKLTYNNDMSTADVASGGGELSSCTDPCDECEKCESGSCVADTSKNGTSCNSGAGTCNAGTCVAESRTFVMGHGGTWEDIYDDSNRCPTGYIWATKEVVAENLSDILNGSKCENCDEGYDYWTASVYGSDYAWYLSGSSFYYGERNDMSTPCLCVLGSAS